MQQLWRERCRHWAGMRRHGTSTAKVAKKPFSRAKSWEVLLAVDNQMRIMLGVSLQHYCLSVEFMTQRPALEWPHMTWATDEGSENMAGLHILQRHLQANLTFLNGPSHGVSRDLECGLRTVGLG